MRLEQITVENLLSFAAPQTIGSLGPAAALIGHNNAGKSNVFRAVSWLLRWPTLRVKL